VIKCIVHYNLASAAGVEDVKVSIFNTWVTIIRGRECTSVKWGGIDWFVLAASALMDNTIFEGQVADILGRAWTCAVICVDKGVVSRVAKVEPHPFSSWVVVVRRHFCLCLDVNGNAL